MEDHPSKYCRSFKTNSLLDAIDKVEATNHPKDMMLKVVQD
jgi:hypothetical protein